jgi:hypothetical protein
MDKTRIIPPSRTDRTIPIPSDYPVAPAKRSRFFYFGLGAVIAGGTCCLLSAAALIASMLLSRKTPPAAPVLPANTPTTAIPSPTGTSLPVSSPTDTSLPASTPTPQNPLVSATQFSDNFSTKGGRWYVGSTDNYSAGYDQGGYSLGVKSVNTYFIALLPNPFPAPIKNIILSVRGRSTAGDKGEFGLVCGYQDSDNFYLSAIRGSQFYIGKMVKGAWTYLTSPEKQPLINAVPDQDGYLSIGMSCIDSFIVMDVNGTGQAHVTDDTFSTGDVGLYVWAADQKASNGYYAQAFYHDFSAKLP